MAEALVIDTLATGAPGTECSRKSLIFRELRTFIRRAAPAKRGENCKESRVSPYRALPSVPPSYWRALPKRRTEPHDQTALPIALPKRVTKPTYIHPAQIHFAYHNTMCHDASPRRARHDTSARRITQRWRDAAACDVTSMDRSPTPPQPESCCPRWYPGPT